MLLCLVLLLAVDVVDSRRIKTNGKMVRLNRTLSLESSKLSEASECIVLKTRSSNHKYFSNQNALDLMLKPYRIHCTDVYGDDDPVLRSELWSVSHAHLPKDRQRGYPQVFIKHVFEDASPAYKFEGDFEMFQEANELTGWIKGEMEQDPSFLDHHDNLQAFIFEEKFADLIELFKPEPTPTGAPCTEFYREAQVGLKCGKHAINAVLKNVGKDPVHELELDEMAEMVGAESHGDDYDMGTLLFTLEGRFGVGKVQSVGELWHEEKPIQNLIKEVGAIEDIDSVPDHLREALERQQFNLGFEDLDWVMCNTHYHWKTYFKEPSGQFCDLDSMQVPKPAKQLSTGDVGNIKCRGIIIPTSKDN